MKVKKAVSGGGPDRTHDADTDVLLEHEYDVRLLKIFGMVKSEDGRQHN